MDGVCVVCGKPGTGMVATSTGEGLHSACLHLWLLPANKRRALQASGRKAVRDEAKVRLGMSTESRVAENCTRLAAAGIAWLVKVPTPFKVVGSNPKRKGVLYVCAASPSIVDYIGLMAGGRFVCVEAKGQSGKEPPDARFYLRQRVAPQQREYLDVVTAAGGLGYLLVEFTDLGVWFNVPWSVCRTWTRIAPEDEATREFEADREQFLKGVEG